MIKTIQTCFSESKFFYTFHSNFQMKYLSLFFILISSLVQAQFLLEEFDDSDSFNEFGSAKIRFTLNNPLEFYRITCNNPTYAEFPGGEQKFKEVLAQNMVSYLDNDVYAVNGIFSFEFGIDSKGVMKTFEVKPSVQNGAMFYKDLQFIVKRLPGNWKAATCNGENIDSKLRLKIDFRTENIDR